MSGMRSASWMLAGAVRVHPTPSLPLTARKRSARGQPPCFPNSLTLTLCLVLHAQLTHGTRSWFHQGTSRHASPPRPCRRAPLLHGEPQSQAVPQGSPERAVPAPQHPHSRRGQAPAQCPHSCRRWLGWPTRASRQSRRPGLTVAFQSCPKAQGGRKSARLCPLPSPPRLILASHALQPKTLSSGLGHTIAGVPVLPSVDSPCCS